MKYKLTERANPQDRTQTKWYATPVNDGRITQRDLAKEIVGISSLSRGDISNVIDSILDTIPKYLLMGKSVSLGDFGTLRLSFSSDGVENANEFTVALIKGVKVLFTPGVELKQAIENIRFEKSV
jgi:predicted histone-like DNA-binding protein